jgi:hypothetical protein
MLKRLLTALFAIIALTPPTQAAFKTRFQSARSAAMGDALAAGADEAGAVFTNPAGIARLGTAQATFMYEKPFAGLPDVNFNVGNTAFVTPLRRGTLGVGLALFSASGLTKEETAALSYGVALPRNIRAGVTVKYMSHSYDIGSDPVASQDPVFRGGASKSAIGFDAGVQVPVAQFLDFGLAVRNANEPNVGVLVEDRVPREIQTGLSLNMARVGMRVAGDLFMRKGSSLGGKTSPVPFLGVEKALMNNLFVMRAGANTLN